LDIDAWAKSMNLLCADSLANDEAAVHEARRQKLRQARHRRKEANLGLEQRTLPLEGGEVCTLESV